MRTWIFVYYVDYFILHNVTVPTILIFSRNYLLLPWYSECASTQFCKMPAMWEHSSRIIRKNIVILISLFCHCVSAINCEQTLEFKETERRRAGSLLPFTVQEHDNLTTPQWTNFTACLLLTLPLPIRICTKRINSSIFTLQIICKSSVIRRIDFFLRANQLT